MEKKTILHTRGEEPKDFADVVLINSKTGDFASFFTPFHNISFEYDQWAYASDLVATSKALDVAIQNIQAYKFDHLNGRMEGCCLYSDETPFDDALNKISEITGGK